LQDCSLQANSRQGAIVQDNIPTLNIPTAIIGGGVAGLWLLNRLRNAGHDAILLEQSSLGHGQSIAAQGIIHGGLKYALGGQMTAAAQATADMPARWRDCLDGRGEIDLRHCRVLSPDYFMWSNADYRARIKAYLGSKTLHGRITAVATRDQPAFCHQLRMKGSLYCLSDFVLDTQSLLKTLARHQQGHLFRCDAIHLEGWQGNHHALSLRHGDCALRLRVNQLLLCAGEGNAALLQTSEHSSAHMQRRPLHMVCVTATGLPPVYMHCIGTDFSLTPKLTITSHPLPNGRWLWYLGGELAESGVQRNTEQQIHAARQLLQELFPGLTLANADWHSFTIDRAEAATGDGRRPEQASLLAIDQGLSVVWPSKLTLCPELGDRCLHHINARQATGSVDAQSLALLRDHLPAPDTAAVPWESIGA